MQCARFAAAIVQTPMPVRALARKLRICAFAALGCIAFCATASAQEPSAVDGVEAQEAPSRAGTQEPSHEAREMPTTIGGGPQLVGTYYYTSPLEKFGSDLLVGSYALNLLVAIGYIAVVYPLGNLFGSSSFDPVMLWMLVPIAGPFFAQYEDSVKNKPFWRVVLIGDAALQATGLVVGLIGLALSGKRELRPAAHSGVELKLGAEGAGLAGVTLSVHTL